MITLYQIPAAIKFQEMAAKETKSATNVQCQGIPVVQK